LPSIIPIAGQEHLILKRQPESKAEQRRQGIADFVNRPGSYIQSTINGRRALSWMSDFSRSGLKWSEYF
jgi:hypothetical protein